MAATTTTPTTPPRPASPPGYHRGGRGGAFGPPDPADRAQLDESPVSWRRVAALFGPYRWQVGAVVLLLVATSLLGLANPFLVRAVIDDALPHADTALLVRAVVAMVAITAISQVLGVLQTWLATVVGQQIMHRLRSDVFTHLQRQSIGFFTRTRGGEITSRLTNDIGGAQSFVTNTATGIATNVTTAVGTAIAMVALSWRLSLISLIILPPAVWTTRKVTMLRRDIVARQQRHLAEMQVQIDEGLSVSGALLAKTLGAGARAAKRFTTTSRTLIGLEVESQLAGRWSMSTIAIVFATVPALLYLAAGLPLTAGGMTIGTLVAFVALQSAIFRPIMGLLSVASQAVTSGALFSRIFGYLDLPVDVPEPRDPVVVDLREVRGELRLEDLTYRYTPSTAPAIDGVSLTVPAGGSLGLVGATGSGKSTLGSLIARLADPQSGRVLIDGVDVRELSTQTLTAIVGVVTQETYLLHASIRDNLHYAKADADDAELWQALEIARIDELVASLPGGLDTVVGARGHRFSGGEKQRLAIARTVLRDPRILVLDEATSALDTTTEAEVQRALDALAVGRTTVTIAHRLSTLADVDEIAVLSHGQAIEKGTPLELSSRGGAYAALLGSQGSAHQRNR